MNGFTLVELLVVLAILGLTLALVAPLGQRAWPGLAARSGAERIAAALRQTRSEAIVGNREAVLLVDLGARALRLNGGPLVALDPRFSLALVTGTDEVVDAGVGGIRFFPDGTSTGGHVTLTMEDRRLDVLVDWITGRVRIAD